MIASVSLLLVVVFGLFVSFGFQLHTKSADVAHSANMDCKCNLASVMKTSIHKLIIQ